MRPVLTHHELYPPISPFDQGLLDVGDGHRVYWEVSGNPQGIPILFVHGGPGAGTQPLFRRFFDPQKWKIILFDQRGCGNSTPTAMIEANTTQHLIADMEKIRILLKIEQWVIFGGSWGSTLGLAYGQSHPARVLGFVLRGVFLCRPSEIQWFITGMGNFFPEAWERFTSLLSADEQDDILKSYARRLNHPDPDIHLPAAQLWYGYEEACARLIPRFAGPPSPAAPQAALAIARLECHYMVHQGFLEPNQLLANIPAIAHLPCIVVQGRYDIICPPATACQVTQQWPLSRLIMVPDAGHSGMENGTRQALIASVNDIYGMIRQGLGPRPIDY
jgi:proline iminopeptidase